MMTKELNIPGNYYDKHRSKNPIVRYLMNNFHRVLFQLIEEASPKSLLDIGCGEGYTTEYIKKHFCSINIEGSDVEPSIIKVAQRRLPEINFTVESACKLLRDDNDFDVVTILEVLEHLEEPDLAIKEAKRVSRKYCLFSVPYEPFWRLGNIARFSYLTRLGNTPGHINHWSKKGFEDFLRRHFNHVKIRNALLWNFALCWD